MGFSDYSINLKIRTKLILFMIVPIITLFALMSNAIYDKYALVRGSKQPLQFTTIIIEFNELLYSLQKERGLSAGFVGSRGLHYRNDLTIQQHESDESLSRIRERLGKMDFSGAFLNASDDMYRLLSRFDRLSDIRNKVGEFTTTGFDEYTRMNESIITIAHHLHSSISIPSLDQTTELYTHLLELQEYAGQERGLLNQSFSQQQFNLELFKKISSSIALQDRAIRHCFDIATIAQGKMLKAQMSHPVEGKIKAIRIIALNQSKRSVLLNELHSLVGYGGLIHDFKNFVIRGDHFYYDRFIENFSAAEDVLSRFRQLEEGNEQQLGYIEVIEKTFIQYYDLLNRISQMHDAADNVVSIDRVVKVDDRPALNAIEALRVGKLSIDVQLWWDNATLRINNFHAMTNALLIDIRDGIQEQYNRAERELYLFIALMLLVFGVTLLLGYFLVNRIAKETSDIAVAMNNMRHTGKFNALTMPTGNDEIGEIITAFNALIEKRDEAEEGRLNSQKQLLEEKNINVLYKLSGGVAHNFNNMLAAILGYTSLALSNKDVAESKQVKSYLQHINDNAEKAAVLVNKIVTYSQSGPLKDAEPIQAAEVIEGLAAKLQQQHHADSIQFKIHIEPGLPLISADKEMLTKMFNALTINAIEAINQEGEINITLQMSSIDGERCAICSESLKGDFVDLSIEDNGRGMTKDMMDHIFEPFFSNKDLSKGAGMGLAVVYGLLRKYNGHVIVTSIPAQGSKFRVLFSPAEKMDTH